jgi:hypothetical protein
MSHPESANAEKDAREIFLKNDLLEFSFFI